MDNVNAAPATPAASDNATPAPGRPSIFEAPDAPVTALNDGAPITEAAAPVTPPVTPPAPAKKAYKFKVDDQEVTEELTDEEVLQRLQKHKGADKRFQEAAEIKRQTERFYQLMKEKPLDVVEKIHGPAAREMMEKHLWAKIQREQMNPQERELLETKERLQAMEADKKAFDAKQQAEQFQKAREQHAQNFDKEIREALAASGKPVTSYSYKRVAHYMLAAMNENRQLSAKDAVPLMDADQQADLKAMFETLNEDNILQILGEPVIEKVRKADLKRVRGGNLPPTPPPVQKKEEAKRDPRELEKRTSLFDWE
jgi:hypothetical protein